ncbi:ATP-binding protein [Tunturiibacter empetritectus]|uniref:histidine kinase n=1 Tax=Tunturiibacter lichenicola TaxID=2051959 RepID=A0A852V838_9BACT|nr:ATP-binding protein [Edaphobacter lichenicola]NYF89148.1 signal transduction histidine kinase [Edaphobacter lichenicola]
MRLKTKLVLSATGLTFAIVLVLSALFLSELLRQRIEQTAAANDVLVHEVWLEMRKAVETGLRANPPVDRSDEALHRAVVDALRSETALMQVMNTIVRYSPTVQDVSVTDAHGLTLLSTDPDAVDQPAVFRFSLASVQNGPISRQMRVVFGKPRVLDISQSLERNGAPFLVVHVGVRSTFLKNAYEPWLLDALIFAALAALAAMLSAGLLANVALRPLESISARLESLTKAGGPIPERLLESRSTRSDAVVRVTKTLDRLGEQMRTQEAGYTALQANLNQMLDTLRDGVLLFTADRRAVMVSDAVAYFLGAPLNQDHEKLVGMRLEEIFAPDSVLGEAVLEAFAEGGQVSAQALTLEDGRQVQFSLDRISGQIDEELAGAGSVATLLTLRDMESVAQLGQELEVARRLAAIGRLTAGVGHEVKNPINAMVLHLELLRGKLAPGGAEAFGGAQRHVEILSGEMQRLDRVVQTLADFSRPMELHLKEQDLRQVVEVVMELTAAEMQENRVQVMVDGPREPLMVRVDAQLMQQALLNLLLNGMQAMPEGGAMVVRMRRDHQFAVVEVIDEGEGIPKELLPRIFELYFTTKPKGSGIGLAMTYRILQLHGGAMEVRSNADPGSVERGTTFTFRVPVASGVGGESRKAAGAVQKELGERV